MDLNFLICSVIALVVLVTVVYPWAREQRERELVKRLEEIKEAPLAMLEVDKVMRQHQHEAGFFKAIAKFIWPIFFR